MSGVRETREEITPFIQRRNVSGVRQDRKGGNTGKKIDLSDTMKLGLRSCLDKVGQADRGVRDSFIQKSPFRKNYRDASMNR